MEKEMKKKAGREKKEMGRKQPETDKVRKQVTEKQMTGKQVPGKQVTGKQENKEIRRPEERKTKKDEWGKREPEKKNLKNGGKKTELCPVYRECGGCQLLHLPYKEQLHIKQKMIEELLKGICPVKPIIGMEDPYHYRNKVHAVFGHDRKGNPISGVYKEGTHQLVPVEQCMIEDEKADEIIGTIRGMLKSFKIRTFDEDTGYGLLRHVLVRRGFATGEIMVVLVTASPVFPSKNNFVKALREKHPEITTIVQNINGRSTSMVLGEKENVLYGKGYIEDVLCGLRFRISSRSFYQINPVQTEKLYQKALELAALTGKETVLDAYCGIGTIGLIASGKAGKVIGVELNQDAVRDAIQNAKRNEVKNIQFYCNDAGRFMVNMAEKGEHVDVVLMDPPRSGSTKEFIDSVVRMSPERVVYVSCGPETLARDLRMFMAKGYQVKAAWAVDMFGATEHVETVCQLVLRKPAVHINIDVDVEELVQDKRGAATYGQIKDYVLEHSGLKVSSLYIAQVKQKYGIIERENYNKTKSENVKQPQCPPEKEKAITEALKHFGMI